MEKQVDQKSLKDLGSLRFDAMINCCSDFFHAGFFPFLTWPYHQWGRLTEQATKLGVPGKVGFVTTLLAMWVLGGLVGLPGFELFKELFEAAYKKLGNREIDVINQIHQHYHDDRFKAEMITHGISRAGGGLDVAQRFGT